MGSIKPSRRLKTVDWGRNGTMMSFDQFGTFLQLGAYHPHHGVVLLSAFEQFDGDHFYDPAYVRDYRARLLNYVKESKPGFGVHVHGQPVNATVVTKHPHEMRLSYDTLEGVHVCRITSVAADGSVKQTTVLSTLIPSGVYVPIHLDLGMSLNRASYGQLTEGGPIPLPESLNLFQITENGSSFTLNNPNLETTVQGEFGTDSTDFPGMHFDDSSQVFRRKRVQCRATTRLRIMPGVPVTLTLSFRLRADLNFSMPDPDPCSWVDAVHKPTWKLQDPVALQIIHGNLEYVLGNCTIPISETSTCVITDHVALPLGWNRDNYWQVRFLMEVFRHVGRIADPSTAKVYRERIRSTVKGHLNWVFHDAQRPQRFWHRSYVATGVPKDGPIFQLDQQCYPIIELCDAWEFIPDLKEFIKDLLQQPTIADVVELLLEKKHPQFGLFPTDETPGDDPVEFPFHFSSHVLVWYAFTRLAALLKILGDTNRLQASHLQNLADETYDATVKNFVAFNPQTQTAMFAYLTDGLRNHAFYHDANDIPTLFAKEWGFCRTHTLKNAWAQTLHFALSPANDGGFYGDGPFGGLGSVHTRGPWPLGYFQELVFAEMQGDSDARAEAWRKIKGTAFFDGLFSEAVDRHTGECTSKAWFSWPGCMIGSALLQDRAGEVLPLMLGSREDLKD
ncbi:hypothetical protein CDV55_107487 [Aspergillus turcosus]|uniref:Alpha-L-rhamnosidase six-hairpin glycosidase domain-containing protein n=1 Tax=Aspergillus turcosus TaxID=1245748 RepID=A0A229YZC3_9EURO|nr:hypothetical protein CDV55_107487 [Aspergillus turcosus]RLL95017.1 hypothetical protein CFD26_103020 [Aspergillus turcosus]